MTLDQLATTVARAVAEVGFLRVAGQVVAVSPNMLTVSGLSPLVSLGDRVCVETGRAPTLGEIIRIDGDTVGVKCFDSHVAAGVGTMAVIAAGIAIAPTPQWKGRVIDALGRPLDDAGPLLAGGEAVRVDADPPGPMRRGRVSKPVRTGVRALDLFVPICMGQRLGIFAGSGVGKSTLLGLLARAKGFDTVVIALVGERSREVREFLEDALGTARASAVTVVSTGDESPMLRRLAPKTAMAIAEYFRDRGESVLLIVDSVTRFAHACREVALAAGEPPVARGYTPSVFSDLPKLLERAGPGADDRSSITGIFSVLVDGDDHNDPIADSIRGTLDGHVVLDRAIAAEGRYPAVDVLRSISRLAQHVWTPEQRVLVAKLRAMVARFEDTRDLRLMGGYQPGTDPDLDHAIAVVPRVYEALGQSPSSPPSLDPFRELADILKDKT